MFFKKNTLTKGRTLDHVAGIYDILAPLMMFNQEKKYSEKIISLLPFKKNDLILDVGCGTGNLVIFLANKLKNLNCNIWGIDAASKMIDISLRKSKNLENTKFFTCASEKLPFENQIFDHVVSTFFFHHIDFDLKIKSLQEIKRVLKKNGKLIIIDVDTPTTLFGKICAWSGYLLFMQSEIKENIQGKLVKAIELSGFSNFKKISHHLGYISIFEMEK
ncbi:MAG: hypothetical protein ACD_79C00166G0005 [uncultured bacterium]|nr:MAG: hypothetical protein ACD_79C00166G0005 [uncultured bacterium]